MNRSKTLLCLLPIFLLVPFLWVGASSYAEAKQVEEETPPILRAPGGVMFTSDKAVTALLKDPLDPHCCPTNFHEKASAH